MWHFNQPDIKIILYEDNFTQNLAIGILNSGTRTFLEDYKILIKDKNKIISNSLLKNYEDELLAEPIIEDKHQIVLDVKTDEIIFSCKIKNKFWRVKEILSLPRTYNVENLYEKINIIDTVHVTITRANGTIEIIQ